MLTVVSDTHGAADARLTGRTLTAVRDADVVVHAGDFTAAAVLDAFHAESDRLFAVHGNADAPSVTDRLPSARTFEYGGVRFAVTHTRRGGATGLSMFGRERDADVVVSGHTHRPSFQTGDPALLNPGSHAEPRGHEAAHAELTRTETGLEGRLRAVTGETLETFAVRATRRR
ncbi:metallophosphoesterase [Salinirarus marinus]|uniref:metallophosphoesterase n=1 Tax=Salinirarus marinus TaxID=3068310 RepID=UPI003C6C4F5F